MTREWPETIRELVEQYASIKEENKIFRRLFAMAHDSEKHRIYGDDGELQCSSCRIDFVRDSAQDIRRKLEASNMRELQRAIATGEWPPRPTTGSHSEPPTPDRRTGPPDRRLARQELCSVVGEHGCQKCGAQMSPGIALENIPTGSPDFIGGDVVTVSSSGRATIVDCLKCERCGHSLSVR